MHSEEYKVIGEGLGIKRYKMANKLHVRYLFMYLIVIINSERLIISAPLSRSEI